jgi:hypothetical protein
VSRLNVYVTEHLPAGMSESGTLTHGSHKRVNIYGQRMDPKTIISNEVEMVLGHGKKTLISCEKRPLKILPMLHILTPVRLHG